MAENTQDSIELVSPGEILGGKFRVERVIGTGGMGTVIAATHLQLDQRVAIKFLHAEAARNEAIVARFQREAKAAAKIRSEHVTRVIDVGTLDDGKPFIVMEYLEGRDLGTLIEQQGPLPIQLAVDYLMQACEALAEAHAAGIVHRDLKPSNLFLARRPDDSEIIKVLDFGISKTIEPSMAENSGALTRTTDVFGSPTYMSPEQLKASRNVDARADIWALGVILHELLTARVPFGGETVPQIFGAILYEPTPRITQLRSQVPAALESVLLRCMEKEPDRRYANVVEFAAALTPFGGTLASMSVERMSRVLAKRGVEVDPARLSRPEGVSRPSHSAVDDHISTARTVASSTDLRHPAAHTAASPGQATATSWDQSQPPRAPAWRLPLAIGAVVLVTGAGGMYWLLGRQSPAQPAPAAEAIPATATPPPPVPIPEPAVTAPASPVAAAPSTAEQPAAAVATSAAVPTASIEIPAKAAPRGTAVPRASGKTPALPPQKGPSPAGDDEFGGRR